MHDRLIHTAPALSSRTMIRSEQHCLVSRAHGQRPREVVRQLRHDMKKHPMARQILKIFVQSTATGWKHPSWEGFKELMEAATKQ